MKKSKKATSIIEAIVILLIITSGVTGMYTIFDKSSKLSISTENKIQGIQIAKQGIEAFTNLRDTNWLQFSSDYINCWNVENYNIDCIGDNTTFNDMQPGSYVIYRDSNNLWVTEKRDSGGSFGVGTYNPDFRIGLDNGIYTQSGITKNILPFFTREIIISYIDTDGGATVDSNDKKMKVISLAQWADSTSLKPHKVELEQILSNWKQ